MRSSFLYALGAAAFALCVKSQAVQMSDPIPLETNVNAFCLLNGVKGYIQENAKPSQHGSFRVVVRKTTCDELLFVYDGPLKELDSVEEFFSYCKEKAFLGLVDKSPHFDCCHFSCSSLPSLPQGVVEDIAVIAVGDFPVDTMRDLIEKQFSSVVLGNDPMTETGGPIYITHDEGLRKVALRIALPYLKHPVRTYGDLKEEWKCFLVHDLLQNRLERCSRFQEEGWVHPHTRFFYPVSGYAMASEEISENLLSFMLWQFETVRNEGFSEEEFFVAKRNALRNIQYLNRCSSLPSDTFLASYYADQFLMGGECHSYEAFFVASEEILNQIQFDDLKDYMGPFLNTEKKYVQVAYPTHVQGEILTEKQIEEMMQRVSALALFYNDGDFDDEDDDQDDGDWEIDINHKELIKSPFKEKKRPSFFSRRNGNVFEIEEEGVIRAVSNESAASFCFADNLPLKMVSHSVEQQPFHQLPLSEKEKGIIHTIITTMAEKNIFQLAFEKRSMEKKGKRINSVHPLRFVGYIFSTHELKSCMRSIRKSSFKWDGFMDGLSKRMRLEYSHNNLLPYVAGFAEEVGADPEDVIHYIEKKDWEGLVKSLL